MDTQKSSLRLVDLQAAEVAKTDDRVTLKQMHDKIAFVEYIYPQSAPTLTIAIVTLDNGFALTGESACADPKNFNKELGQKFACENAIKKIWALEGYILRERLYQKEQR